MPLGGLGLRGVQLLEQRSLQFPGGGVDNKVPSPPWDWCDIVHLGVCVRVDTCKFKTTGFWLSVLYLRSCLICVHTYTQSFGSSNSRGALQRVLPVRSSPSPPSPLGGGGAGGGKFSRPGDRIGVSRAARMTCVGDVFVGLF